MNEVKVVGPGKPRIWDTEDEFKEDVKSYVIACEGTYHQFPNISGFCVWMDIHRATFYEQKDLYPDAYKKVQEIFENSALNSKQASDTMKIFYMKKKFPEYADNVQVGFNGPLEVKVDLDRLSDDDLKKLKELTAKIEAL